MTRIKLANWLLGSMAVLVALMSYRFLILGFELSFPELGFHIEAQYWAFAAHVVFAPIALFAGVVQFSKTIRSRNLQIHRVSGRIYAISILVSGIAGIVLSLSSLDRPFAAAGFGLLAVLWIFTTAIAVQAARRGNIDKHKKWMMRSYALTFAAVTLRLQLLYFIGIEGMSYVEASPILAWISWIPNLLLVEWFIRKRILLAT